MLIIKSLRATTPYPGRACGEPSKALRDDQPPSIAIARRRCPPKNIFRLRNAVFYPIAAISKSFRIGYAFLDPA